MQNTALIMAKRRNSSLFLPARGYQVRSANSIRVCHIYCEPPPVTLYQRFKAAALSVYNYLFTSHPPASSVPLTTPDTLPPPSTYSKLPPDSPPAPKPRVLRKETAAQTSDSEATGEKRLRDIQSSPKTSKKRKTGSKTVAKPIFQVSDSLFNPQAMERLKTGTCSSVRFLAKLQKVNRERSASPHESDLSCPTTPEPDLHSPGEVSPEPVLVLQRPATPPQLPLPAPTPPVLPLSLPVPKSPEIQPPPVIPSSPETQTEPMNMSSIPRSPSPPPRQVFPCPLPTLTSPSSHTSTASTALPPTPPTDFPVKPTIEETKNDQIPTKPTIPSNNPFLSPVPTQAASYKFVFGAQSSPEKASTVFVPNVSPFILPQSGDTEMDAEQHGAPAPLFPAMTFPTVPSVTPFSSPSLIPPLTNGFSTSPAVFGSASTGQPSGGFNLGVVKKKQR